METVTDIRQIDQNRLSPMMRQYVLTRLEYPDCILFYRLGDFYEMFFDDAITVSRELELTLTGKACGLDERAPMCGVPYHAAESYLTKLVSHGFKVAICEQTEDPKCAKGLVKREVTRIVTPGTNLNLQALDASRHNYLMCIYYQPDVTGIALSDMSTGDFYLTEIASLRQLNDELVKYMPSEIVANEAFFVSGFDIADLRERLGVAVYPLEQRLFDPDACRNALQKQFHVSSVSALGIAVFPAGMQAAGASLKYMQKMQQSDLSNFTRIYPYRSGRYMMLDAASRRNLELTETLRDKTKRGTLFWVLDKTCTAMGARQLRDFIEQPLTDLSAMQMRQDAVEMLLTHLAAREDIRSCLKPVYDLERLMARISYQTASPRDLLAFGSSLEMLPALKSALSDLTEAKALQDIQEDADPLQDLHSLITQAIDMDAPLTVREGGLIRDGFDADVDRLREADARGKQWLIELEEETRARTGIKNLRIKYSNNFGYAFEVTRSFLGQVPDDFIRRQTLTNCERFTTPRLKELEDTILGARDKLFGLEYDVFCSVRDRVAAEIDRVQKTARAVARLDALQSLAQAAEQYRYVKPALSDDAVIDIRDGRHPVVELMQDQTERFVSNDTLLDMQDNRLLIITGPNMAGKSTYMRQTALIVLMAQIGSFVPAKKAQIGITDRIFTRVGASDDLASGRSTFMVEMSEVANILRNATARSLLILDEIGRGTSTCDGLAIAKAVAEYIADPASCGARTLFATHYHELNSLQDTVPGVKNLCSTVKENADGVVFLRKIIEGGADKSYGIQVARIAGVPEEVISRAQAIAETLEITEQNDLPAKRTREQRQETPAEENGQISLFAWAQTKPDPVVTAVRDADVSGMTPIDALNLLNSLQLTILQRDS